MTTNIQLTKEAEKPLFSGVCNYVCHKSRKEVVQIVQESVELGTVEESAWC